MSIKSSERQQFLHEQSIITNPLLIEGFSVLLSVGCIDTSALEFLFSEWERKTVTSDESNQTFRFSRFFALTEPTLPQEKIRLGGQYTGNLLRQRDYRFTIGNEDMELLHFLDSVVTKVSDSSRSQEDAVKLLHAYRTFYRHSRMIVHHIAFDAVKNKIAQDMAMNLGYPNERLTIPSIDELTIQLYEILPDETRNKSTSKDYAQRAAKAVHSQLTASSENRNMLFNLKSFDEGVTHVIKKLEEFYELYCTFFGYSPFPMNDTSKNKNIGGSMWGEVISGYGNLLDQMKSKEVQQIPYDVAILFLGTSFNDLVATHSTNSSQYTEMMTIEGKPIYRRNAYPENHLQPTGHCPAFE